MPNQSKAAATVKYGFIWLEINNGTTSMDQRNEGHRAEALLPSEALDLAMQLLSAIKEVTVTGS